MAKRDLVLWDDVELAGEEAPGLAACRSVGEAAGMSVISGQLATMGVT